LASILAFGASLPLVTPISGYAYVRVSKKINNKITPEAHANVPRKNRREVLFGKLRGKLNIIIVLHFWYIYDILQTEVFCDFLKIVFRLGYAPDPAWGAHDAPPNL